MTTRSRLPLRLWHHLISGLLLWLPLRRVRRELLIRDGFLVTALFWSARRVRLPALHAHRVPAAGARGRGVRIDLRAHDHRRHGADGPRRLPPSILLYRQLLQWLGGIGIIVVAVAVLPMLGIGGMQLYRAETPGPSKDSKLTPRITETAKALFSVYLLLT
jgi:trk system potassium uptake protein TrkH